MWVFAFLFVMTWRYFTGHHMDGRRRRNNRGKVLPGFTDYYWNRITRPKRALWRNLVFLGLAGITYGLFFETSPTIYLLFVISPFFIFQICRKLINAVTMVTQYSDSDGVTERYRILRPKYRRWIRDHKPSKVRVALPDGGPVPPDVARAIEVDNAEDHGAPIVNLRLMEQMAGENDVTNTPITGRAKTIARKRRKEAS